MLNVESEMLKEIQLLEIVLMKINTSYLRPQRQKRRLKFNITRNCVALKTGGRPKPPSVLETRANNLKTVDKQM